MRVHELAAELAVSSKELLAELHALGQEVKGHMSSLDEAAAELMREKFQPKPVVDPILEDDELDIPHIPNLPNFEEEERQHKNRPLRRTENDGEIEIEKLIEKPKASKSEPAKGKAAKSEPAKQEAAKAAPAAAKEPKKVEAPPAAPPQKEAPKEPEPRAEAAKKPELKNEPETVVDGKTIRVKGAVVVRELAERLGLKPNQLVAELMGMNILASIGQRVDVAVAKTVAERHGFSLEHEKRDHEHKPLPQKVPVATETDEDREDDLQTRPPVVTFLGHVDHGKTSLLDKIRNAEVARGEHGGITQHIGAYTKDVSGRSITFLDTPGHAAFTAMRARGANMTDIAVIIVAADDGIMPQTKEAIQHAKAAKVSIMVAINKIDLPAANPDRVKQQLQAEDLAPEDWGGSTIVCPVSAVTGEGIDHLLEMIALQAEVLELKASLKRRAKGFVIEARMEHGMGPTANLLVTHGTLKIGDSIVCGSFWGRVKALINDHGLKVKTATPSMPVRCLGLSGVPEAGAEFKVCPNEREARDQSEATARQVRVDQATPASRKVSLADLFKDTDVNKRLELRIILKTDVQGSIEAITHALREIKSDKVSLNILLGATGNVTSNDVMLASASNAVILGFHVGKEPGVDIASRREGVEVQMHNIIYELIDQVRDAMAGLLSPELRDKILGRAEIRQVFPIGKTGNVAGCMVVSGSVRPRFKVRVKRGEESLFQGSIASLKRFKDSAAEVREGQDCGLRIENFEAIKVGDILEFYEIEAIKQTL
jgi:translation initiation factor IF-2